MNNKIKKTLIIFLILGLTSCSYKPIFSEKNYNFEIDQIFLVGNKNINKIVQDKLQFIKKSDKTNKKKYNIRINSQKVREIISKDTKGDPLKFEMTIKIEFDLIKNEIIILNKKIEKNRIYNNETDQFELEQKEKMILDNLSMNISDVIISSIINLDDN
jgi:outer membrane lipopolysaccharide assembly protein LptE/RlpB